MEHGHLIFDVNFFQCVAELFEADDPVFVEIGFSHHPERDGHQLKDQAVVLNFRICRSMVFTTENIERFVKQITPYISGSSHN